MTLTASVPATPPYSRQDWQKGYESLETEHRYWITDIEGTIPADLTGTLFRNGPGRMSLNGDRMHHPFDGDGMICAVSFADGQAFFQNRYVRTEGFLAESAAQEILYRGVFGTQKPGGVLANAFDFRLKNIANTNVIYWGNALLALWEAGLPHALDPYTLDTLGPSTLNGQLTPTDSWSAHPRVDPCGPDGHPRLVNFAIKPGLGTEVQLYEVAESGTLLQQKSFNIPGFAFIHDFVITPQYAIFFQNPVSFNPLPFAVGLKGAAQCISLNPSAPTRIWVVPRHTDGPVKMLETDPCFVFHHANAYEQNGGLVIDSVCYDGFPSIGPDVDYRMVDFEQVPAGQLWQFQVDLDQQTVQRQVLMARSCEFPTLHPQSMGRPYQDLFIGVTHQLQGNAPLQAIAHVDVTTGQHKAWSAAPKGFISEPLFIPRSEGAGWVMAFIYDADHHRTDVVILDSTDIEAGPVARLHLQHHIPYGLHGSFTTQVFRPESARPSA